MAGSQPAALSPQCQEGPENVEQGRELMIGEPWLPPCQSPEPPSPSSAPLLVRGLCCVELAADLLLLLEGKAHQSLLSSSTITVGFGVFLLFFFFSHMQLPLLCISWEKIRYNIIFLIFLLCLYMLATFCPSFLNILHVDCTSI